jgi:hypothetical protein
VSARLATSDETPATMRKIERAASSIGMRTRITYAKGMPPDPPTVGECCSCGRKVRVKDDGDAYAHKEADSKRSCMGRSVGDPREEMVESVMLRADAFTLVYEDGKPRTALWLTPCVEILGSVTELQVRLAVLGQIHS